MTTPSEFQQQCSEIKHVIDVKRWVIALSGGLDSMVTLELAHRYLSDLPIIALHVNHQQQSSANAWQEFCEEQCALRNIPYHSVTVSPQGNCEKQLRDARYQCFENFIMAGDCLLFGHHANDQAETMLFRLVRGAGVKGLSAMPRQRSIGKALLLRPLLSISREQLASYAKTQNLVWIDDPSNNSLDYDRNFLRHKVLAPLTEHWPKASEQMSRSALLLSQEHVLLNQYLASDLPSIIIDGGLDLTLWKKLEEIKAHALLRYWINSKIGIIVGQKALQRIIVDVIESRIDSAGFCPLGAFELRRFKSRLYIVTANLAFEPWPVFSNNQLNYQLLQGSLSLEPAESGIEIKEGMYLQHKVDGMTLVPVNRGRKKLKKLFQEQAIPPWQREYWPLIMFKSEIVAIPGICICEGWLQQEKNKSLFWPQWQAM
ncbi:MAG: tRNA lysidine(34) synthetase TilS [Oceanospirillaceae bacterium]|nr:tRNA lysidine(34) synthetase TilS [Oceanospirillaceae bacterium]